jgi:hypothetical protein
MRINEKLKVRHVAGEHIVMMQTGETLDMTRVVSLNESALALYNALLGRDFEIDDAVRVLMDEYEVAEADARRDVEAWIAEMRQNNLIV